jgi:hypothetical protein
VRLVVLVLSVAACSHDPGSGQISGMPGGANLTVRTAYMSQSRDPANPSAGRTAVTLTDATNACTLAPNDVAKSSRELLFNVAQLVSSPGTFSFSSTAPSNYAAYIAYDDNCQWTAETLADGTVTFTTVSPDRMTGTFDIQLYGGEHLSGSFDAPHCAGFDVIEDGSLPPPRTCR